MQRPGASILTKLFSRMYRLVYTAEAKKEIQRLPKGIQQQLKGATERLATNPQIGKRLTQELSNFWSYRSGDYRILYKIFHQEIVVMILTVGDRKTVYEKASRRFR